MKYKLLTNAWLWFGVFCVGLFFITYWGLGVAVRAIVPVEPEPTYSVSEPLKTTYTLPELWERESWAVQQTKKVLVSDSKPSEQVLYYETPQLSPGLERIQ